MNKIFLIIIAAALTTPIVASATDEVKTKTGKNLCVLNSENCTPSTNSDSIYETISKIQIELKKGTSVYTEDEINQLESKLNERKAFLNTIGY